MVLAPFLWGWGRLGVSIRTPALAGGESCVLSTPSPLQLLPQDCNLPPSPPPPLLSTIKSRPCQSSRRGHESLSAACSSPELSPPSPTPPPACWRQRHFARDWLLPSPRRARGVWGRAVSGDRSTPAAGPRAQPRPGEISHTPFTPPPPSVAPRPVACLGALPRWVPPNPSVALRGHPS